MLIYRYKKKIEQRLYWFINKNKHNKNIMWNKKDVIFYFPDSQFQHYGDYFFFEPSISSIHKTGYNTSLIVDKNSQAYLEGLFKFEDRNFNLLDFEGAIISRPEFFLDLKSKLVLHKTLFIDLVSNNINTKICDYIYNLICYKLGTVKINQKLPFSSLKPISNKVQIPKAFIHYNEYADSALIWVNKYTKNKMRSFATILKAELNLPVVLTGSKRDRKYNPPNFVDIDLRGQILPRDLFSLIYNGAYANISYDTFPMHVSNWAGIKNYVYCRGRFLKSSENKIRKYYLQPSQAYNENLLHLLN